jgi:hypothetical protein
MQQRIPIFITIFDRLEVLKTSIQSYYDNISTPFEIIIHDQGTTYQPTLDWVKTCGFKYYKSENSGNAVGNSIKEWYKTNDSPFYVVTDPDIALVDTNKDILEVFMEFLKVFDVPVVGCSLDRSDIPDYYPLKQKVLDSHHRQFGVQRTGSYNNLSYIEAFIDTTFAMYRSDFEFKKHNKGIRVLKPYEAKHLDWYINPNNLTADQIYYMKTTNERGHWGGLWLKEKLCLK